MRATTRLPSAYHGFAVVEILIAAIILVILTVLVGPQITVASNSGREAILRQDILRLRTQIVIYQSEHGGTSPGYHEGITSQSPTDEDFVAQLTQHTDQFGNVSAKPDPRYPYGPYLEQMIENPINKSSKIRFISDRQGFPSNTAGPEGWMFQPSTATIVANNPEKDSCGIRFFDY
jgi:type II secretory pathway pseudopilin PulG